MCTYQDGLRTDIRIVNSRCLYIDIIPTYRHYREYHPIYIYAL